MRYRVLGPLEVSEGNGPTPLGGPKQRLVLAHLLLRANQVVAADHLIDALWGEEPPEAARGTLQAYVSRLRSIMGADRIEGRAPGYLVRLEPEELDVLRFEALVREAGRLSTDPRAALETLAEALELWRGPALADLAGEPSLQGEIARLEELRLKAAEEQIAAQLEIGRHAEVVAELEALVAGHPLRERLWGSLMLALYRSGRQAEAVAVFQRARELLADELGIDPSKELQHLHERILRQDPDLDVRGEPLRGYRLLEQIGEGAFGVVHRALQPQVGREVAIKAVHPELANHPDFVRRFEREAQLVARLEHPHVVPLYDYWREPDAAYLVMRFLRGGSLTELLDKGPLEAERSAAILDQVASALTAAHRQGVVHRDVKPDNILLDEDGNAYLTDFGVALDAGAPERTSGTMLRGTPAYLSPEQIRLEPATPTSDVYALGVVLFEVLTGEHPFPETALNVLLDRHLHDELSSVRDARPELPPAVDDVIRRATAKDPRDRYPDAIAVAAAFRSALGTREAVREPVGEIRNPYKGLRAFLEADAADFFGREAVTRRLLQRLAENDPMSRFLAVVGPSGSGKSSMVRAGLVPAIRNGVIPGSEGWYVVELMPGAEPLRELESALLRVAIDPVSSVLGDLERDERGLVRAVERILPDPDAELVIVLDQMEELFTLVQHDAERSRVLASLRAAVLEPGSRIRIVATLRADFFDLPLSVRGFGELLAARTEAITPMSPEELERAIVGPADAAGLVVEPRLLAAMIADVADRPGALPLLQYALTELADRQREGALTIDAYRRIGGVSGALARRAEQLFDAVNETAQDACRQLFLRLVTLGEGSEDTRRRVRRSELLPLSDASAMDGVIEAFGRHRLLSFDRDPVTREPTVEIAHEALLGIWGRLRGWIDDARDDIRTLRQLADAGAEWMAGGRDPSFLLRGARLEQVSTWADTTSFALTSADREYLDASVEQRDEELAARRAAQEREQALERRSVNRLRALVAVLTTAVLVAGTLTLIALDRNRSAQRASRLAAARELAGAALSAVDVDPQLATLLALVSIDSTAPDGLVVADAELALRLAVPSLTVRSLGGFLEVSLTPDLGRVAIVGDAGPTAVWEFLEGQAGRRVFTVPTRIRAANECPFDPGSQGVFPDCEAVFHAALSPDGSLLATGHGDRLVRVWDLASGRPRFAIREYASLAHASDLPGVAAPSVGFSPDGRYLWTQGRHGGLSVWNLSGAAVVRAPEHLGIGEPSSPPGNISFSEDGTIVAIGGEGIQFWDLERAEVIAEIPTNSFFLPPPTWAPGGHVTAIPGQGTLTLVDPSHREETLDLPSVPGGGSLLPRMSDLAFSPDGSRIAAATLDGVVRVWDVATQRHITLAPNNGAVTTIAWAPDARVVATGGTDHTVRLWDAVSGGVTVRIPVAAETDDLAFTADGARLAIASEDGTVQLHLVSLADQIDLARDRLVRGLTDQECRQYLHVDECPA